VAFWIRKTLSVVEKQIWPIYILRDLVHKQGLEYGERHKNNFSDGRSYFKIRSKEIPKFGLKSKQITVISEKNPAFLIAKKFSRLKAWNSRISSCDV
jgi:hypothetical protein